MKFMRILLACAVLMTAVLANAVDPQQYQPKPGETVLVLQIEGQGEVAIRLETQKAPKTTAKIIGLAQSGFYNGQKFFKVVNQPKPFIVQFGDPGSKTKDMSDASLGTGGSGQKVAYEDTGLSNVEGSVGFSTPQGDRNGGDSQFYINMNNNRFLDGNYTVFGMVVKGLDVVKRIKLGDQVTSASIKRG